MGPFRPDRPSQPVPFSTLFDAFAPESFKNDGFGPFGFATICRIILIFAPGRARPGPKGKDIRLDSAEVASY